MEPHAASFLTTLAKAYPGLALFAGVTLLLGILHELRILIDVLTLLVGHFRGELAGNARAFGRLGGALSNGNRHAEGSRDDLRRHRRKRSLARRFAWLRKQTRVFYRPWRNFTRHRRRDVLH